MAVDREKQRERWRRNKRAQRDREKRTPLTPEAGPADYVEAVFRERDRRANLDHAGYLLRYSHYFAPGSWEKAIGFAADVWAASEVVKARYGSDRATVRAIREQLEEWGRTHDYKRDSLRAMIRKAQRRITLLEETGHPWNSEPYWAPFDYADRA